MNNVIETAETTGEKRGIAKGKAERDREIARTMLIEGLPIELIVKITQLSKEEIEQLKSEV